MKIGPYVAIYGAFVLVVGLFIPFVQVQTAVSENLGTWAEAPIAVFPGSLVSIGLFTSLLAMGYAYRNRPEAHKRYMLLAPVGLLRAAKSRIQNIFMGEWGEVLSVIPIGAILIFLVLLLYDLYTEGRVHPATLIGTGILLLGNLLAFVVGALSG